MTSSIGTLEKEIGENVCSVLPFPLMYDFKQMVIAIQLIQTELEVNL